MRFLLSCLLVAGLATAPVLAETDDDDEIARPLAGLMAAPNRTKLPEVMLSVGEPLGGPWELRSGGYYSVEITSDGSGEIGLAGADFFHAIWVDEVVIEGLEVRPTGLHSLEFDDPGTMKITFIAVKPGSYALSIPGSTGESQRLAITIE
ncbi:hypothetical protein C8J27_101568 [Rhodobacter aestuarii]|uniref:MSP domain-containing protein n=1 Tax=Rhodobacter aestuarii TaxID=453582 RepID=A0A1N7IWT4_9RHOB|nr:hypothetical protein [Rhodobacter aestuarii]PTV97453.1 hypothetical protein C8J27_101568 [Rhodobacter aestuarii]SIS41514.1 hypothetical protein SAMN05421580_10174 [Rhodobacter aestuarii]